MGYIGFQLGLAPELIKLAGVGGGIFLGFRYYQEWGDFVSQRTFLSIEWGAALMMVTLMVAAYLTITQLLRWMENLVKLTFQSALSNGGGLIVGIIRAALVMSMMLVALRQMPSPYLEAAVEERSLTGGYLVLVAPQFYDALSTAGRFWWRRLERESSR